MRVSTAFNRLLQIPGAWVTDVSIGARDVEVMLRPRARLERAMLERRFAVVDTDGNGVWQRDDYRLLTRRLCETFGHTADSAAGRAVVCVARRSDPACFSVSVMPTVPPVLPCMGPAVAS